MRLLKGNNLCKFLDQKGPSRPSSPQPISSQLTTSITWELCEEAALDAGPLEPQVPLSTHAADSDHGGAQARAAQQARGTREIRLVQITQRRVACCRLLEQSRS